MKKYCPACQKQKPEKKFINYYGVKICNPCWEELAGVKPE